MKLAQCAALELIHGDSFMPAAEPHIVAHFVPLSVIMSDHGGDLASYMAASGSSDVVVLSLIHI